MKLIPLSSLLSTKVDDCNFAELSAHKWSAWWNKNTHSYYAVRQDTTREGKQITVYMHRDILGLAYGDPIQGDHRNSDTLDNQRRNLRKATHSQSQCNRRRPANNKSGFKGVSLFKRTGQWRARIAVNGKELSLGYFATPEAAHQAYCDAAQIYHGEFARTI